jgi:precorrin-6A/cobalt-precorrin-6A reductase
MPHKVLLLGGTGEARELAGLLHAEGYDVMFSLAGVTDKPVLPACTIRIGGFGGVEGLHQFLVAHRFAAVIDATHPFATQMSRHGSNAAKLAAIHYSRLEREPWSPRPGDAWNIVADFQDACQLLPPGARVLLTIGRQHIDPFLRRDDLSGVLRCIEPPEINFNPRWKLHRARPPFTVGDEVDLMRENGITHLLTKNAGGAHTEAKLQAARILGISVIMIARPPKPAAEIYADAEQLCMALRRRLGP